MIFKTPHMKKKKMYEQQSVEKTLVRVFFRMKEECGLFSYKIYQLYLLVDAVSFLALLAVQNCAPSWSNPIKKEMYMQVITAFKSIISKKKRVIPPCVWTRVLVPSNRCCNNVRFIKKTSFSWIQYPMQ